MCVLIFSQIHEPQTVTEADLRVGELSTGSDVHVSTSANQVGRRILTLHCVTQESTSICLLLVHLLLKQEGISTTR